jgi:hypothetical protein
MKRKVLGIPIYTIKICLKASKVFFQEGHTSFVISSTKPAEPGKGLYISKYSSRKSN